MTSQAEATSSQSRILNGRYALSPSPRSGGMGTVYRASDLAEEHAAVAVKLIHVSNGHRLAHRVFEREYKSLVKLEHHPNVVRLLDAGRDAETDLQFLVFEWIERDLKSVIEAQAEAPGWDEFARNLLEPILSAIARAHELEVVHRDIKPANILVTDEGVPKIADFGTAKYLEDFAPGLTLADWRSKPFAAPDGEGVRAKYSGDVYSAAVTALAMLSGVDPYLRRFQEEPVAYVTEALAALDAPAEALDFLQRCTSTDPDVRFYDGGTALTELQAIGSRRRDEAHRLGFGTAPTCYLKLPRKPVEALMADLELSSREEVEAHLLKDLESKAGFLPFARPTFEDGRSTEGHFYLIGSEFRCHVQIDNNPTGRLLVHNIRPDSGVFLDRDRERAWQGAVTFRIDAPIDPAAAEGELSELLGEVLETIAQRRRLEREEGQRKILGVWRKALQALTQIERGRESPLEYRDHQVRGRSVEFALAQRPSAELTGQLRVADLMDGSLLAGEVSRISGDKLLLRVEKGDIKQLSRRGKLRVDTRLSQSALRRQEAALDAVHQRATVRADLEELLLDPGCAELPTSVPPPTWIQDGLDEAKREAVRAALGSRDLLLVEGPPGTGKTTLIVELIAQELRRNPDTRILLSSQTHVALDNVLERLEKLGLGEAANLLRVGRAGDERIAPGVEPVLIGSQLGEWRKEVLSDGRAYLRDWAADHGISARGVEIAMRFDELASVIDKIASLGEQRKQEEDRLQALRELRRHGGSTSSESVGGVQDQIAELESEVEDLDLQRKELLVRLRELGEIAGPEELADIGPVELRERAASSVDRAHPDYESCSRLVRLLADWHAQFGYGDEFEAAALVRAKVVAGTCVGLASVPGWQDIEFDLCIVDEASKANATELLIPMTRAKRWVLVGDHRQLPPYLDQALLDKDLLTQFELSEEEIRETLFERLRRELPSGCKTLLSQQHRMVPAVGELVSSCFYAGELTSAPNEAPGWLRVVLPTPVTWLSTSDAAGRGEERAGKGRANPLEARCIRNLLGSLNLVAAGAKQRISVGVLAGYREQCEEISRQIAEKLPSWEAIDVECNTVDAFQGREVDVVVYSVTRSNVQGRLGFLAERRRLNVALSRGRLGLVIVGDDRFARSASGENPFRPVLDFIHRYDGCSIRSAEL
jgi:hypothetical protein